MLGRSSTERGRSRARHPCIYLEAHADTVSFCNMHLQGASSGGRARKRESESNLIDTRRRQLRVFESAARAESTEEYGQTAGSILCKRGPYLAFYTPQSLPLFVRQRPPSSPTTSQAREM